MHIKKHMVLINNKGGYIAAFIIWMSVIVTIVSQTVQ